MKIRLAIILGGSMIVGAAGGMLAAAPVISAVDEAVIPLDRGPTPELERARATVLASLLSTTEGLAHRAAELELLTELMAEAAGQGPRSVSLTSYVGGSLTAR